MKKFRKLFAVVLAATMVLSLAACEKNKDTTEPEKKQEQQSQQQETKKDATPTPTLAPIKITISLPSDEEHLEANSWYDKLVKEINEYCNADITWEWQAAATYYDAEHLGLRIQTGDVADVLVVGNDSTFITAAEEGLFWDLADYYKDYPNLAAISQAVIENSSYNGKLYCLPRLRNLGRNGWGYRVDWLNNLNLAEPTDWDSFVDMLYAFTYNDPDMNGLPDTIGLGLDSWSGAFDIMGAWFNVPTTWGLDAKGNLINKYETEEYMTAMKAFRDLYAQGLINQGTVNGVVDFKDVTPGKARTQLLGTGLAGVGVQVLDDMRKVETGFETSGLTTEDEPIFTLASYVDTGYGWKVLPTTGTNNFIAISKRNIKTEEQLRQVLNVIDKLNDGVMLNLIEYGWEGVTYKLNENGYVELLTGDELSANLNGESSKYAYGFNQIPLYSTAEENARPVSREVGTSPITKLEETLKAENEKYCIPNYGASFKTETEKNIGGDLNQIMADAQLAFIRNEIDEAAFRAAIKQWKQAGGDQMTKEMNELYAASKK